MKNNMVLIELSGSAIARLELSNIGKAEENALKYLYTDTRSL